MLKSRKYLWGGSICLIESPHGLIQSLNVPTLYLTPMHAKTSILKSLITNIRAALQHVRLSAEQFKATGPLGSADALCERQNRPQNWPTKTTRGTVGIWVNAGFRLKGLSCRGQKVYPAIA
jgi:type II secretory pathway pseudopilin PulG